MIAWIVTDSVVSAEEYVIKLLSSFRLVLSLDRVLALCRAFNVPNRTECLSLLAHQQVMGPARPAVPALVEVQED